MGEFIIECHRCAEGDETHRAECLVAILVDAPDAPLAFDDSEDRALRALREGGLLPPDLAIPVSDDLRATGS
ncbi:MAG: hypothetical protein ACLGH3_08065 [Actinomycetota bacterium]